MDTLLRSLGDFERLITETIDHLPHDQKLIFVAFCAVTGSLFVFAGLQINPRNMWKSLVILGLLTITLGELTFFKDLSLQT